MRNHLLLLFLVWSSSTLVVVDAFLPGATPGRAHHPHGIATDDHAHDDTVLSQSRWQNLNPKVKDRIIANRERAIENKKKREPDSDKKRRAMMFYKEQQRAKARASRVVRPIPLDESRTPLDQLQPGQELPGTVISLTKFGAYVDVGSQCDGLLHISQISNEFFVESPRQVLRPGDAVTVRVRSVNPSLSKLHLTMLPPQVVEADISDKNDPERIPLNEILVDDELWGEIKRVTDFGAYVEVGAVADGFLHFMDHPIFASKQGEHPSDYMKVGDRVRVWVSDVDPQLRRIKLTANRPPHLPGPRREIPL